MIPVRGAPPGGLLGIRGDRAPPRLWTEHGCSRGSPWLLQTAPRRPAVPGALRDRALQGREQPARSMSSSRGLSVKRPRRRLPFASVSQGPLSLAQLSGQVGGQLAQAAIPRDPAGGQLRRAFIPPSPGGRTSEVTVWPGPAPPAACPWHVGVCLSAPRPRTRIRLRESVPVCACEGSRRRTRSGPPRVILSPSPPPSHTRGPGSGLPRAPGAGGVGGRTPSVHSSKSPPGIHFRVQRSLRKWVTEGGVLSLKMS